MRRSKAKTTSSDKFKQVTSVKWRVRRSKAKTTSSDKEVVQSGTEHSKDNVADRKGQQPKCEWDNNEGKQQNAKQNEQGPLRLGARVVTKRTAMAAAAAKGPGLRSWLRPVGAYGGAPPSSKKCCRILAQAPKDLSQNG